MRTQNGVHVYTIMYILTYYDNINGDGQVAYVLPPNGPRRSHHIESAAPLAIVPSLCGSDVEAHTASSVVQVVSSSVCNHSAIVVPPLHSGSRVALKVGSTRHVEVVSLSNNMAAWDKS